MSIPLFPIFWLQSNLFGFCREKRVYSQEKQSLFTLVELIFLVNNPHRISISHKNSLFSLNNLQFQQQKNLWTSATHPSIVGTCRPLEPIIFYLRSTWSRPNWFGIAGEPIFAKKSHPVDNIARHVLAGEKF